MSSRRGVQHWSRKHQVCMCTVVSIGNDECRYYCNCLDFTLSTPRSIGIGDYGSYVRTENHSQETGGRDPTRPRPTRGARSRVVVRGPGSHAHTDTAQQARSTPDDSTWRLHGIAPPAWRPGPGSPRVRRAVTTCAFAPILARTLHPLPPVHPPFRHQRPRL